MEIIIITSIIAAVLLNVWMFGTQIKAKKYWYRQYLKEIGENGWLRGKLIGESNDVEECQKELIQYRYFINNLGLVTSLDQEEKIAEMLGKARILHHTWENTGMEPEGEDRERLNKVIISLNEYKISSSDD